MANLKAWQGVLWKEASFICFALINGIGRYLTGGSSIAIDIALGAASIVFFQNLFGSLVVLAPSLRTGIKVNLKTSNLPLQIIRAATAVLGVLLWVVALKYLPVIQVVALRFSGIIFTILAAKIFLKEQIDFYRGIAILLSVIGSCIVARVDNIFSYSFELATLLPIASAIATTASKIIAKKLINAGDTPKAMTNYILLLMVPLSFAVAVFDWHTPALAHLPWLLLLGILAAGAHFSLSHAYTLADVTFLMPFKFSKLIMGAAISYFIFAEVPKTSSLWIGITVICTSVFFLVKSKHK